MIIIQEYRLLFLIVAMVTSIVSFQNEKTTKRLMISEKNGKSANIAKKQELNTISENTGKNIIKKISSDEKKSTKLSRVYGIPRTTLEGQPSYHITYETPDFRYHVSDDSNSYRDFNYKTPKLQTPSFHSTPYYSTSLDSNLHQPTSLLSNPHLSTSHRSNPHISASFFSTPHQSLSYKSTYPSSFHPYVPSSYYNKLPNNLEGQSYRHKDQNYGHKDQNYGHKDQNYGYGAQFKHQSDQKDYVSDEHNYNKNGYKLDQSKGFVKPKQYYGGFRPSYEYAHYLRSLSPYQIYGNYRKPHLFHHLPYSLPLRPVYTYHQPTYLIGYTSPYHFQNNYQPTKHYTKLESYTKPEHDLKPEFYTKPEYYSKLVNHQEPKLTPYPKSKKDKLGKQTTNQSKPFLSKYPYKSPYVFSTYEVPRV